MNKKSIETIDVPKELFEKAFLEIQQAMEEHEIVFRAEQAEAIKIASETFLNF